MSVCEVQGAAISVPQRWKKAEREVAPGFSVAQEGESGWLAEGEGESIGGGAPLEGHVIEVVQQAGFGKSGVGERTGPEAPGFCPD